MKKNVVIMLSTYNGERFLEKQLESLSVQEGDLNILLYIRDDGSKDKTIQILKLYEEKLNIIYAENSGKERLGPAESFWYLLKTAPQADCYFFADQDDVWDKRKIKTAVCRLEGAINSPALYCCNGRIIDADGNKLVEPCMTVSPLLNIPSQLICGDIPGCAMGFNSLLHECIKNCYITKILMHDLQLMIYAILFGRVIYDNTVYYSRRVHENNVIATRGKNNLTRVKDSMLRWKRNRGVLGTICQEILYNDKNTNVLDQQTKEYLENLISCKQSAIAKYNILKSQQTISNNPSALRSFKIRVILNMV